ncbi:hypothetical protein CEP51_004713 [Fusarium floridanum]|uniref:Alpha-type protein kinase domain-containing protein n=1 Tax=Fusarium floridanum TaxID=1325733 RepID=A0A428RZV2_9HYPO|nr:hypothetical protein CEP51_004713 [Fusarium floridanum]
MRECADCGRHLPRSSYTANQYSKGVGVSRCASCIHGHPSDTPSAQQSNSGRYNISNSAFVPRYALENPFAQGSFRWVAKGSYSSGTRQGQACVVKWFKTGAVFEADYFTLDIKAVDKALEIVNRFNELNMIDKDQDQCTCYHVSGGQFVLCDLQGGIYQREIVLSDPVILSRNRDYGVTDLGSEGPALYPPSFEEIKETLRHGIVIAVAPTAHRVLKKIVVLQDRDPVHAYELRALVRMD